eukprot:gnl/MRDRNA2_/MRDRNA2_42963_c0_seq1.p1 gnl/MRDRNA2_/MRDRNA2_42963_c0~~gnl/MRDRNA2_/MRDRNA2_42963_c0_seq1.p1  ORF type:complete len:228 (+),score=52.99 gnl/MRDRNA2_/MRDRNA2_42963_c0_seq1:87-770(+)
MLALSLASMLFLQASSPATALQKVSKSSPSKLGFLKAVQDEDLEGPMDSQAYEEEKIFNCGKYCILATEWGKVTVTSYGEDNKPDGRSATFRDIMTGPGWVKEWNWGHHAEHVTHKNGIPPGEIDEVHEEMAKRPRADELDKFYLSLGVRGVLQLNQHGKKRIGEWWPNAKVVVEKSDKEMEKFNTAKVPRFLQQKEHVAAAQEMVAKYNAAVQSHQRVAMILHSTC